MPHHHGLDSLSHPDRDDQIHVFTLDEVLGTDVEERLRGDERMGGCKLIRPQGDGIEAMLAEVERLAVETIASRVLIFDVRSHTLPQLRQAYNHIVGYNRRDFNELCYSLLIGDGPLNLFGPGRSPDIFGPQLAELRTDYHAAAFFYDPFVHYSDEEKERAGIDYEFRLPESIPRRLGKAFQNEDLSLADVRRYFRAAAGTQEARQAAKQRRRKKLIKLFRRRIAEEFPDHKDELKAWLSREGHALEGEPLRLHLYPLYFEDWVFDLLEMARNSG